MINGYTSLNITKLDVLSGLDELKLGVAYKIDGKRLPKGGTLTHTRMHTHTHKHKHTHTHTHKHTHTHTHTYTHTHIHTHTHTPKVPCPRRSSIWRRWRWSMRACLDGKATSPRYVTVVLIYVTLVLLRCYFSPATLILWCYSGLMLSLWR